jgi:hypothetical protein
VDKIVGFYDDKLSMAGPLVCETDHLIALCKTLHSLADSGNDACQVATLPGGKCGWPALVKQALTDGGFAWINTGGLDLDEDLFWTRLRSLDIYDLQHVDLAILIKSDGFGHDITPFSFSLMTTVFDGE